MAWVRSEQSLAAHPKTKRAARALQVKIPHLMGHLHCLWHWSLDYAPDGDLTEYEPWEIAEAAMFDGDPDAFIDALISCGNGKPGFLETQGEKLVIHDWYDYAGRFIEQREANAERMRSKRASHVQNTCDARTGATKRTKSNEENEEKKEKTPPPPVEKSPREAEILAALVKAVQKYPLDEVLDLELLREPHDPRVDTLAQVRKWRDYHEAEWRDWKKRKPPNYRLSWRNWLDNADRFCVQDNGPLPPSTVPWEPPEPPDPNEEETPMPDEVRQVMAGIGRTLP